MNSLNNMQYQGFFTNRQPEESLYLLNELTFFSKKISYLENFIRKFYLTYNKEIVSIQNKIMQNTEMGGMFSISFCEAS